MNTATNNTDKPAALRSPLRPAPFMGVPRAFLAAMAEQGERAERDLERRILWARFERGGEVPAGTAERLYELGPQG